MPALAPTDFTASITWLGLVPDRDAALQSQPRDNLFLGFDGPEGEAHGGALRPSCSRVVALYPRGTPIRNTRQLSILCAEELAQIAAGMRLDALDPAHLGTTMVVSGLPDFSHLPPSSRLLAESGAALVIDMHNRPCQLPARVIEGAHPGRGKGFKPAAKGLRGVTAWVEAEGELRLGEKLRLFIPDQRAWNPGAAAGDRSAAPVTLGENRQ